MTPSRHPALLAALLLAGLAFVPAQAATAGYQVQPRTVVGQQHPRATIELMFVLDTTGSMGGMLEGAKAKIWGIVNDVLQQQGHAGVSIRVGLVAYRDRGDAYVTRVTALSDNLDSVYAQLMSFRPEGGGDGPEDVRSAMMEALRAGGWSAPGPRTSQVMFLVGDAPPHDDYVNLPSTVASAREASRRGIIVNAVQCGNDGQTSVAWRHVAQHGGGEYFAIAQDGGVEVVVTPYDQELARLGEQIGGTYMAYGRSEERRMKQSAQVSMESRVAAAAPAPAKAERALNKALNDKAYDNSDLVQQSASGAVALPSIAEAELPDALRKLAPGERQAALDKAVTERKALREKIVALSKQRDQYLTEQRSKKGGAKAGFDAAVSGALAKQ
ncbi:MAG: vWA domain-containing protein, partial [Pseudomonadota bacterium]